MIQDRIESLESIIVNSDSSFQVIFNKTSSDTAPFFVESPDSDHGEMIISKEFDMLSISESWRLRGNSLMLVPPKWKGCPL